MASSTLAGAVRVLNFSALAERTSDLSAWLSPFFDGLIWDLGNPELVEQIKHWKNPLRCSKNAEL